MNQLQTKPKFSLAIQSEGYKKLINNTLGDPKRASKFVASITSAVATNQSLQECDAGSILSAALLGEALNLSPSPQLGQYYLVPFEQKKYNPATKTFEPASKKAQFQIGYKGYLQLAMRSGQYRDLDVTDVRSGEYLGRDKNTGKHKFEFMEDEVERENEPVVGYMAYFELLNGFRKSIYWTKEKMQKHAEKYSQAYANDIKKGTSYSFWSKDFDGMAFKTMYRHLCSKCGAPMSIEMPEAYTKDMSVVKEDGTYDYVDTQEINLEPIASNEEETETKEKELSVNQPKKINIDEI